MSSAGGRDEGHRDPAEGWRGGGVDLGGVAPEVARAASADAGGAPTELLGDYLTWVGEAGAHGRRLRRAELVTVRALGERAAESGLALRAAVDLYLSATWRLWPRLPSVADASDAERVRQAGRAVLRAADDAVAALAEGYQVARQLAIRREESARRELVDDLLTGSGDLTRMARRAERFGLLLTGTHQVAVADIPHATTGDGVTAIERDLLDRLVAPDPLVVTKESLLVVIAPHTPAGSAPRPEEDVGDTLRTTLARHPEAGEEWRVAVGRPHAGPGGVRLSYEEARGALDLAPRLRLHTRLVRAEDLLVYQVLLRDRAAITDLVRTVLGPVAQARGGPAPLLDTLATYFATGAVATETARRLPLSVRAVTYRLDRIRTLTGYDPGEPEQRFTLHTAVLGAQLLDWPTHPLPAAR